MAEISFYLDENLPTMIAHQLRSRGIDCVTVQELGHLGNTDEQHLERVTNLGRVLCTFDYDFLRLAVTGAEHAGIVMGQQSEHYIGDWVKFLELMHAAYTSEEMLNRIEFL